MINYVCHKQFLNLLYKKQYERDAVFNQEFVLSS